MERIRRMNTKEREHLMWQYCNDPNDIEKAIEKRDENWEGLESVRQIVSITYDTNHGCYVVFWIGCREGTDECVIEELKKVICFNYEDLKKKKHAIQVAEELFRKKNKDIIDLSEWHKFNENTVNSELFQNLTIGELQKIAKIRNWSVEILIKENNEKL